MASASPAIDAPAMLADGGDIDTFDASRHDHEKVNTCHVPVCVRCLHDDLFELAAVQRHPSWKPYSRVVIIHIVRPVAMISFKPPAGWMRSPA